MLEILELIICVPLFLLVVGLFCWLSSKIIEAIGNIAEKTNTQGCVFVVCLLLGAFFILGEAFNTFKSCTSHTPTPDVYDDRAR